MLTVGAFFAQKRLRLETWQWLIIYLVPYLLAGFEVLREAVENIAERELLGEAFLMSVATAGALVIGFLPDAEPQFTEAVAVMIFFRVGEMFEELAEGKSRASIAKLMDIRPDTANVERDGTVVTVPPEEVAVGETIVIRPGERIPLDGVILEGSASLDTAALTGESMPREVSAEDGVVSGSVDLNGVLRVRVSKVFGESTVARILDLVENAAESKGKSETFISRFAAVYTPIVVGAAVLVAFLPPVIQGQFALLFPVWLKRALTFLVASCPCALVISVPLAFFSGIGGASRQGILIKGSAFMETLAKADAAVFDKTGTLTKGVFTVVAVHTAGITENELIHLAAHAERYSTHPVALALRAAYPQEHDECTVQVLDETAGRGIRALVNGSLVLAGNEKLLREQGIDVPACAHRETVIHVAREGKYLGHIAIDDTVKPTAAEAVSALRKQGVKDIVMLTGDRREKAEAVANALRLDRAEAELLPEGKVEQVKMLRAARAGAGKVLFVGDGINDAPVLASADVGIAMGALGSDAAIEAADIVLMDDDPLKLARAIELSRRTLRIVRENVVFALAVKAAVLILAALGIGPMWLAVFADVGVMVLAVLNATRALRA